MSGRIFIAMILLATLSRSVLATCDSSVVEAQLTNGGFLAEPIGTDTWGIRVGADDVTLQLDSTSGDLLWSILLQPKTTASVAWVNQVHSRWRYVQLAVDSHSDLYAFYAIPHWGQGCVANIDRATALFLSMSRDLRQKLNRDATDHMVADPQTVSQAFRW